MSPHLNLSWDLNPEEMQWNDRIRHSRFFRLAVKKSYGDPLSNLQVVRLNGASGEFIFALGGGDQQTVVSAQMPDSGVNGGVSELCLKPLFGSEQQNDNATPSAEAQLFYERMRSQVVNGLVGYSFHPPSNSLLLASFNSLKLVNNGEMKPVAGWFNATILNATICPSDSDLVAFCSGGQLYIDCKNSCICTTTPKKNRTHGVASFISQEELERFEGYWWNPRTREILCEEVDESDVTQLAFEVPGKRVSEMMRYPLTGTNNPVSSLKLLVVDKNAGTVAEKDLPVSLQQLFPWYEYLVRAGWADELFCYVLLMNRKQSRQILALIDKRGFGADVQDLELFRRQFVFAIHEEQSNIWLNANNLLYFLPRPAAEIQFLYGSEKSGFCHLYLQSCKLRMNNGQEGLDVFDCFEARITYGDWPVIKETPLSTDPVRCHVYFLANIISPLTTSLCVASYMMFTETKVLTPPELCYKQERGVFNLNVNPEVGFVAWLSSINQLPECRFYRLVQSGNPAPNSPLPDAVFQYRIRIQPSLLTSPGKEAFEQEYQRVNITEFFRTEYVEYQSSESGFVHNALVFLPTVTGSTNYPIIHHVYAGPSVQQVKNSWPTVAQFLRYLTLGYAVVVVDGRGSANRGILFEGAIKNNLGNIEVKDQVEGLAECIKRIKTLDPTRIVVTGWSYGGYMALLLLCNHPDIYKAACAGGAVSDWNLYDTCYTERYMDLPKDNPVGYKSAAVMRSIQKFPDQQGKLLIVHGLIDENVHFHHAEQLMNALITAGKPFEQLIFPSERHGIRQGPAVEFFHASQLAFFAKAFQART